MTTQFQNLQFKRGSKSANDALVGPSGSISIDMESGNIRIHDGETPGGKYIIERGAQIDAENLEFTTASESQIASGGQTIFTLSVVDTSTPEAIQVKVNGEEVTNWTVINGTQIQFDVAFTGGEQIEFLNVKTLNLLIAEALGTEGGTIETTVQAALEGATSVGGIEITDIATSDDIVAINQSIQTVDQKFQDYIPASDGIDCGVIE